MNWEKLVGPATFVYLATITVGGIWWASDLSTRMKAEEDSLRTFKTEIKTDMAGLRGNSDRITRLETLIGHIDRQLDRIETKLDRRADIR